jgi:sarcosine dehydrogenase
MISVQGPHSRALLTPLVNEGSLEDENMPFSTCHEIVLAGVPMYCLRLTFVGELGFELHVPSSDAVSVYRSLRSAGDDYASKHGVPVLDAGYRAIDSLSAEMNYRHWHADLSNADTPMEANIGFTVLSKLKREDAPDFIGRDALQAQRKTGLKKKLVCLTVSSPETPLFGMETIWRNGECLGLIRSTAYGYTIEQQVAYGYIRAPEGVAKITKKWLQEGSWEIGDKGKRIPATFHTGAPYNAKLATLDAA